MAQKNCLSIYYTSNFEKKFFWEIGRIAGSTLYTPTSVADCLFTLRYSPRNNKIYHRNENSSIFAFNESKIFNFIVYKLFNYSYKNFRTSSSKFTKELLFTISITKTREEREKSLSSRCCFRGHKHPYAVRKQVACSHLWVWYPLPTSSDRLSWQVCRA